MRSPFRSVRWNRFRGSSKLCGHPRLHLLRCRGSASLLNRSSAQNEGSVMASQTSGEMKPRKVLLFSGHMIDSPTRKEPRFPADKEPIAVKAIGDLLDQIAAERGDLAICGGACGGDLVVPESPLARGL